MKAHDQFSVVFTWNVVFQNSDQFLYLTSSPSYDCGFVSGQRYIMTIYIYIYIYIYLFIYLLCVVSFQANMPTDAGHSSENSEYTANSFPADENTPLVGEANSKSRQHRLCEQFNCRHFFLRLFLLFFFG